MKIFKRAIIHEGEMLPAAHIASCAYHNVSGKKIAEVLSFNLPTFSIGYRSDFCTDCRLYGRIWLRLTFCLWHWKPECKAYTHIPFPTHSMARQIMEEFEYFKNAHP